MRLDRSAEEQERERDYWTFINGACKNGDQRTEFNGLETIRKKNILLSLPADAILLYGFSPLWDLTTVVIIPE
jgi:hypothetical protein